MKAIAKKKSSSNSSTGKKTKYVYFFGKGKAEGNAAMKSLLGGKGANLAEMCRLGITVLSGVTISTEACTAFTQDGREAVFKRIEAEVLAGVRFVEADMGKQFGNNSAPLLLSVRSGARASMPGMWTRTWTPKTCKNWCSASRP